MSNLPLLLIILPIFASFLILLSEHFSRIQALSKIIALVAVAGTLFLILLSTPFIFKGEILTYELGGWKEPLGISLKMDGLAYLSCLIGIIIGLFALIYAWDEENYSAKFYFFFLLLLGGMQGVILTNDLFNMFVFFEILSIASYILITCSREVRALRASLNYLLISSLGMSLFLLGIGFIYQECGVLSLSGIGKIFILKKGISPSIIYLATSLLAVGIGVKAAFIPLHTWLPDAHAYAPTPVSAILSGVMIKVSFLALWRIIYVLQALTIQYLLIWIGALTALLPVIWALSQSDLKKLLAYHSISQMGFIIASFGVGSSLSLTASFYHIINHSLFKSLLFLSVGAVIYATGARDISELSGLYKRMPGIAFACGIGALSISGVPPLNGFVSKNLISLSLKSYPLPALLIFLASIGTVASFTKLLSIFWGKSSGHSNIRRIPKSMTLPLFILCGLCLLLGIFPSRAISTISHLILSKELSFPIQIYSFSSLWMSLWILVLGVLLYRLIISEEGRRISSRIKQTRPGLSNSLSLVMVALIAIIVLSHILTKG
jgi:multicomponent Na+:H+ antiporter subunit D